MNELFSTISKVESFQWERAVNAKKLGQRYSPDELPQEQGNEQDYNLEDPLVDNEATNQVRHLAEKPCLC
jgi:hypothetical protein